jgi:hypothetical protein
MKTVGRIFVVAFLWSLTTYFGFELYTLNRIESSLLIFLIVFSLGITVHILNKVVAETYE